jgi:hypothetical protein
MKPPPRLLDDPEVAPELRTDLQRAADAQPRYDVAAGLAALGTAIGTEAGAGAGAGASAGKAGASALSLKIGAGVVVLATVGGLAAVQLGGGPPASERPAPAATSAPTVAPTQAPAQPAPSVQTPQPAAPTPVPEAEPQAQAAAQAEEAPVAPAPRGHTDPDADMRREIAQLQRLRSLVERNPRRAYRLAAAGHREFGQGMLYEEREGLAIMALQRSGQHARAARRLRSFEARFPSSPLLPRLREPREGEAQ